jgi:hypothetical protein
MLTRNRWRIRESGVEIVQPRASIFTVREGKIARARFYANQQLALEAAGIELDREEPEPLGEGDEGAKTGDGRWIADRDVDGVLNQLAVPERGDLPGDVERALAAVSQRADVDQACCCARMRAL